MSASQESQPTLDSIAPRFLVGDMEQALAFYGQLGFTTTYHDEGFAIVERDGIALHFNASEEPPKGRSVCWIGVTNIGGRSYGGWHRSGNRGFRRYHSRSFDFRGSFGLDCD